MVVKTPVILSSVVLLLATTWGCSTAPTPAGNTNASKQGGANATGTDSTGAGSGTPGAPAATPGTPAAAGAATTTPVDQKTATAPATGATATNASGWCAAAAATSIVKTPGMAKPFAQLCANGQATTFLADTLVKTAYAGTGAPALQMINPISDPSGTVTAFFGVGIKLPLTSKVEFGAGALGQGSVANAIQLVKNQGDTPGAITSVPVASNPDKGWVRGWTIENISTKAVAIVNIKTDYITQVDQYDLGGGYYMYTSQLKKSIETMKDYQLLTASFDINGVGYLLTVAQIAADDHGFSSIAIQAVSDIATATIKFMYTTATAK
jgi:hypothetical protein